MQCHLVTKHIQVVMFHLLACRFGEKHVMNACLSGRPRRVQLSDPLDSCASVAKHTRLPWNRVFNCHRADSVARKIASQRNPRWVTDGRIEGPKRSSCSLYRGWTSAERRTAGVDKSSVPHCQLATVTSLHVHQHANTPRQRTALSVQFALTK